MGDTEEVLSIGGWNNNAELIADVARLGYIGDRTIDLTYGHGKFWTIWQPPELHKNDLNPDKGDIHHDWTHPVPLELVGRFDTVVFDPDYRLTGTSGTAARDDEGFSEAYGLDTDYKSEKDRMAMIMAGCTFAMYCAKKRGTILVKCQDQQVSNRKVWQTVEIMKHIEGLTAGFVRLEEMFHLTYQAPKQPEGRRQVHARSNYSTLMVFRGHGR